MSKRNRKELDNEEYEVEKILDTRIVDDKEEVLVKWKGYSSRYNTWEPKENIRTCIYESPTDESRQQLPKRFRNSSQDSTPPSVSNSFDSEKENSVKSTRVKRRKPKKEESQEQQIKLRIVKKDKELMSETLFEHKPPEIEKIVGKRIKPGNSVEYLIQFKNLSAKNNIWEPAENKDIQAQIADYESQLVKQKNKNQLCKQEPNAENSTEDVLKENTQNGSETACLDSLIKDINLKKVNFEIFENDSTILLVKDEQNFVLLDKLSDKYSFCQAVLNVTQIFQNTSKDNK